MKKSSESGTGTKNKKSDIIKYFHFHLNLQLLDSTKLRSDITKISTISYFHSYILCEKMYSSYTRRFGTGTTKDDLREIVKDGWVSKVHTTICFVITNSEP